MNVVPLTDMTTIQRHVPQSEFGQEPPPCPLNPEQVRVSDFRAVKKSENRAEMVFSRGH
jgi:hypothetical protein